MEIKRNVQFTPNQTLSPESLQHSVENSAKKETKVSLAKTQRDLFEPTKHSVVTKDIASASVLGPRAIASTTIPFVGPIIGAVLAAVSAVIVMLGQLGAKSLEDQAAQKELEAGRKEAEATKSEASLGSSKFGYPLETEVTRHKRDED